MAADAVTRFCELQSFANEFAIRAETLGVWTARMDLAFNRIERWEIEYDGGHVCVREWERGIECSWMPAARREFEAGLR
jgi:hypothetical protein